MKRLSNAKKGIALCGILVLLSIPLLSAYIRVASRIISPIILERTNVKSGGVRLPEETVWPENNGTKIVKVPFTIEHGQIIVKAKFGRQEVRCVLDTGCGFISWPQTEHIVGQSTNFTASSSDAGGIPIRMKQVIIPQITIGNYQIRNVATFSVPSNPKLLSLRLASPMTVLGDIAFKDAILTVDFRRGQILLRRPMDKSNLLFHSKEQAVKFGWRGNFTSSPYPVPVLRGNINGKAASFLLDTGWTEAQDEVIIGGNLARQLDTSNGDIDKPLTMIYGAKLHSHTIRLPLSLLGKTWIGPVRLVPNLHIVADGIVGQGIFRHFQVTIDYPGKRVWLHPYVSAQTKYH